MPPLAAPRVARSRPGSLRPGRTAAAGMQHNQARRVVEWMSQTSCLASFTRLLPACPSGWRAAARARTHAGQVRPAAPGRPATRAGRAAQVVQPLDPRIHFALVCGARSCPPIRVYTEDALEEGLAAAAAAFCESAPRPRSPAAAPARPPGARRRAFERVRRGARARRAGEVEVRSGARELVMSKIFSWCGRPRPLCRSFSLPRAALP
jgi:hypothetical protein